MLNRNFIYKFLLPLRIHASDIVAFSSRNLIPSLTTPFWLDYTTRVLIQGFDIDTALPQMLACTSTSPVVRHTNLVICKVPSSATDPFVYRQFVWTHPELRPFGHRLPINCTSCGCLSTFTKPVKYNRPGSPSTYTFLCSGNTVEGTRCVRQLTVEPIEGFQPYGNSHKGAKWMVKEDVIFI